MELVDFARALGFDVVCTGKGKNNPLDRSATPETRRGKGQGTNDRSEDADIVCRRDKDDG